jgi:heme/copper-type cytochrome/quinol oxidase subunit 2
MPIAVEVVSKERFAEWVAAKQAENGITPAAETTVSPSAPAAPAATPVAAVATDAKTTA